MPLQMLGQQQCRQGIGLDIAQEKLRVDLTNAFFRTLLRYMQQADGIDQPVQSTDLIRPDLDGRLIGNIQLVPVHRGVLHLRRVAMIGGMYQIDILAPRQHLDKGATDTAGTADNRDIHRFT